MLILRNFLIQKLTYLADPTMADSTDAIADERNKTMEKSSDVDGEDTTGTMVSPSKMSSSHIAEVTDDFKEPGLADDPTGKKDVSHWIFDLYVFNVIA